MPDAPIRLESDEVLDLLTSLVQKSLVVYEEDEQGQGRYRLLEPTRQYSRDRLLEAGEVQATRDHHAAFYLRWAEQAEPELRGADQIAWLDRFEEEHDNLRAALEWSQTQDSGGETELRLVATLSWFWMMRNHFREGRQWLDSALARGDDASLAMRARALAGAAQLASFGENNELAERLAEECLPLARAAGEEWVAAWALFFLGDAAAERLEFTRATALGEESLAVARDVGDPWLIAQPLCLLGLVARFRGKFEAATALLSESLSLLRAVGDRWARTLPLLDLGAVAARMTALDREQRLDQGDLEQATRYWHEALALYGEMADKRGVVWCLHCLGWAAVGQGQAERAMRLYGAAEALRETSGGAIPPRMAVMIDLVQAAARAALTEEACEAARAQGQAMSIEQAIADALKLPTSS